jgi:hypothetical protein
MNGRKWNESLTMERICAAALAAFGAASAIPLALAQLDFAGIFNVFNINGEDSAQALRVFAGVSGILTFVVLTAALAGAGLTLAGSRLARAFLITATVAGFVTATIFWIPNALTIGAAVVLLGRAAPPARSPAL